MEITEQFLETAVNQVSVLLKVHLVEINQGFVDNDEIIDIPIKVRFSFVDGKLKIASNINFVKQRCKDDAVIWYDPVQKNMFDD